MKKVTMVMVFLCFALAVYCFVAPGMTSTIGSEMGAAMLITSAIALGLGTIAAAILHRQDPPQAK
jgi:uncharacterized membrane protein YjfL (UPF0719 family)